MKIRDRNGTIHTATLSTEHAASNYGQPVLVIGKEAYGTLDATLAGFHIAEATDTEREQLRQAGYGL